jgi:hypothetical protein
VYRAGHAKKEIEEALRYAESSGWRIEVRQGGHCWGRMYCPFNDEQCRCGNFCVVSIWSTPRDAGNHAKDLRRVVDNCARKKAELEGQKQVPNNEQKG